MRRREAKTPPKYAEKLPGEQAECRDFVANICLQVKHGSLTFTIYPFPFEEKNGRKKWIPATLSSAGKPPTPGACG